jgi:simple sugar transport system permease protein
MLNGLTIILEVTIRAFPAILMGGLAGLITQRIKVGNLGLEGFMLIGAFVAVLGSYYSGSCWFGILLACLVNAILCVFFIIFNQEFKADNVVMSVAINMFALGITKYLLSIIFGVKGAFSSPKIIGVPKVDLPFLENIPLLGAFAHQSVLVYVALLSLIIIQILLFKTSLGLRIRATGPNEMAVVTAGVDSKKIKIITYIISGVLCGLAGAYLSLGQLTMFTDNMTNGRGFISMAAANFGFGLPIGTFYGALLFGFADGITMRAQLKGFPPQLVSIIPYLITILTLCGVGLYRKYHLKDIEE